MRAERDVVQYLADAAALLFGGSERLRVRASGGRLLRALLVVVLRRVGVAGWHWHRGGGWRSLSALGVTPATCGCVRDRCGISSTWPECLILSSGAPPGLLGSHVRLLVSYLPIHGCDNQYLERGTTKDA